MMNRPDKEPNAAFARRCEAELLSILQEKNTSVHGSATRSDDNLLHVRIAANSGSGQFIARSLQNKLEHFAKDLKKEEWEVPADVVIYGGYCHVKSPESFNEDFIIDPMLLEEVKYTLNKNCEAHPPSANRLLQPKAGELSEFVMLKTDLEKILRGDQSEHGSLSKSTELPNFSRVTFFTKDSEDNHIIGLFSDFLKAEEAMDRTDESMEELEQLGGYALEDSDTTSHSFLIENRLLARIKNRVSGKAR